MSVEGVRQHPPPSPESHRTEEVKGGGCVLQAVKDEVHMLQTYDESDVVDRGGHKRGQNLFFST